MGKPTSCLDCPRSRSCNSAMGINGCGFFFEEPQKSKTLFCRIKEFLGKVRS